MGIIGLGLFLSAIAAFGAGRLVLRFTKRFKYPLLGQVISIAIGMLVFCGAFLLGTSTMLNILNRTYVDMDPREGEQLLGSYGLPEGTTSDFCYHTYYAADGRSVYADFEMTEVDFLAWMKAMDWPVSRIDERFPALVNPVRSTDADEIKNGYVYSIDNESSGAWFEVTFDLDAKRAYLADTSY